MCSNCVQFCIFGVFKYSTMAAIAFQYRSTKHEAPLEARLYFWTDKAGKRKRVSLYGRTQIVVSKSFWADYRKGVTFRDNTKANFKKEVDDHCHDLKAYIIDQYNKSFPEDPAGVTKEWLAKTIDSFYNPIEREGPATIPTKLVEYWDYYLESRAHEFEGKLPSYRKWVTVRNKVESLQEWTGEVYEIKEVDGHFMKKFIEYSKRENYSNYTTQKEFSYIKTVCNHARAKGMEVSLELDTLRVKLQKKPTAKIYLSFEELDAIGALQDLPDHLDNVRDWLIISCYTGQRISDFMRFDKSMIREERGKSFLDIKQRKTGKSVSIPLLPEVVRILDKRGGGFPRAISHQRYNDYVKDVCELAGLTDKVPGGLRVDNRKVSGKYPKHQLITSHAGRRSFATNYYGKIPTSFLKDITGHGTEQMLLKYIGKSSKDTAFEAYDLLMKVYQ